MNLKVLFITVFMVIILSACGGEEKKKISPEEQIKIDAAIEEIKSEPRVHFFSYDKDWTDWNVAVMSDGNSEYGYANYICEVINGHGINPIDQDVQILDAKKLSRMDLSAKEALLIRINCSTRNVLSR